MWDVVCYRRGQCGSGRWSDYRFTVVAATDIVWSGLLKARGGVFGVVGFSVRSRTRELGVRLALGATAGRLQRDVVGRLLPILTVALVVGLLVSLLASRALASVLYGVGPTDPIAFGGAITLIATMSLLATYLAARGVYKVDPARVIEYR